MGYRVEYEPRAFDEIMALPDKMQRRIFDAAEALESDPRPAGVEKMKGEKNAYRVRVGDYRIIYEIHDDVLRVMVFAVGHRREMTQKTKRGNEGKHPLVILGGIGVWRAMELRMHLSPRHQFVFQPLFSCDYSGYG